MFLGEWYLWVLFFLSILSGIFALLDSIHVWQLEGYKTGQYLNHQKKTRHSGRAGKHKLYLLYLFLNIVIMTVFAVFAFRLSYSDAIIAYVFSFLLVLLIVIPSFLRYKNKPKKKPLVYTGRTKRYIAVLALVIYLLAALVIVLCFYISIGVLMLGLYLGADIIFLECFVAAALIFPVVLLTVYYTLVYFRPYLFVALAAYAAAPMEKCINKWYFNDGKKKLASYKDMIKIGITGSYGKTSCKVILGTILSEKYNTLITPHSYNTPMGVTRVIREQMKGDEQVFIAEMGARNVGDIKEMCDLVAPKFGLITSIGPQHLETFKTLKNVANTKYELIEALPQDGAAFFPDDGGICRQLYDKTEIEKFLFSIDGGYMSADGISLSEKGSSFELVCQGGESIACTTKLLGRHNIQNILGCAAVARRLGLSMPEIAAGISKVEPVEHRLQLMDTQGGVTVIDDAFNSNPAGTKAALDVLSEFKGRKIIITPGLVELGDEEYELNKLFGMRMAEAVDVAILVAGNSDAIAEGLNECNFEESNIIRTGSLSDATAALSRLVRPGDVVLFENDLPDHYEQ